jgi:hypothetical protein
MLEHRMTTDAPKKPFRSDLPVLKRAALGFRAHSGWAALVALGGAESAPSVVRRGRIELCNRGVHRQGQPYHAAAEMKIDEAREFLDECARTASGMAEHAVREAVADLYSKGYRITGACVLTASGRPLPALEKVLAAHPLIHTAEGEFFRNAVRQGCEACGLRVTARNERELKALSELYERAADLGKLIGPPWRQDEKLCATAAWLLLAP